MMSTTHPLAEDYVRRLDQAARALPPVIAKNRSPRSAPTSTLDCPRMLARPMSATCSTISAPFGGR
jgi:hypothetical protein